MKDTASTLPKPSSPPIDRGVIVLILLGATLFLFLFKPWIHGDDGVRYYVYLRSMIMDGDIDFENEFDHYHYETIDVMRFDLTTGRLVNAVPCGSSLLWAPWFLAVHGGFLIGRLEGLSSIDADGYSPPYVIAVCLGSVVYALWGLLLLYLTLRRWFSLNATLSAVVALWLASPLVFYMYAHPSMSHANSFFAASALLWACARWGDSMRPIHWAAMGAIAGLAMLVRFNNILLVLFPAFTGVALWTNKAHMWERGGYRDCRIPRLMEFLKTGEDARPPVKNPSWAIHWKFLVLALVCAFCAVLVFSPQLAAWKYMHGQWLSGPKDYKLEGDLALWKSPWLMATLFSGRRGVFFWMPVAWIVAFGWLRPSPVPLPLRLAAPMVFLLNAWLVGGWVMWWAGASFGPRFFISCLPAMALGLAAAFEPLARRRRWLPAALVVALTLWNFGLMAQYALRMIDREGPLQGRTVLYNQLLVPREILRKADVLIHRRDIPTDTRSHP